jgi:hypothetical protein
VAVVVVVEEAVDEEGDVARDHHHHALKAEADHVVEILDQDPRASQNQEAKADPNHDLNLVQDQSQEMINHQDHQQAKSKRNLNPSLDHALDLVQSLERKVVHDQEVRAKDVILGQEVGQSPLKRMIEVLNLLMRKTIYYKMIKHSNLTNSKIHTPSPYINLISFRLSLSIIIFTIYKYIQLFCLVC